MVKVTFAIGVCNEARELDDLLHFLINEQDVINHGDVNTHWMVIFRNIGITTSHSVRVMSSSCWMPMKFRKRNS